MASNGLRLAIQFWTSRGFAVLDVNYSGSSGYGRAYRDSLAGQWGVFDVQDCVNGARYLVEQGEVDGERLIIRGGSAGGFTLTAIDGRNITIGNGVGTSGTAGQGTAGSSGLSIGTSYGKIELSSTDKAGIALDGELTAIGATTTSFSAKISAGAGVSSLDLSTVEGSQDALTVLDAAINTITDSRASMGAYQNRLLASISNLETTSMNLSASRSRILDTDYAKETTNLAKSQIITQAATAMLAQANQGAQSVLALLK
jgi:flagellin